MNKLTFFIFLFYLAPSRIIALELPIVVLVCSYNNEAWVAKNLDSIFMQDYTNYRVVYIDDCSKDATADLVQDYAITHTVCDKITLIRNTNRCRKMKNVYTGIHTYCDDNEIVVQLDGDDWFIDAQLFSKVNDIYQNYDIWLTYGSDTLHYAQPTEHKTIAQQSYREKKWIYAPTRTFYAWLFKLINVQDLIAEQVPSYQGLFFPSADDVAFMFPMLEMAGPKVAFLPDINYHVNTHNPLSNKKIESDLQESSSKDIRSRPAYAQLTSASPNKLVAYENCRADIFIVSDNAHALKNLLNSIDTYLLHHEAITIFVTNEWAKHQEIKTHYPEHVIIMTQREDLSYALSHAAHSATEHIVQINGRGLLQKIVDLRKAIYDLEKTGAHAFYFAISNATTHDTLQHVFDDVYAWKLAWSNLAITSNTDMVLVRKKDILTKAPIPAHAVGLCLEQAALAIPDTCADTYLKLAYPSIIQKKKKRRLHVPGIDPRTKTKK